MAQYEVFSFKPSHVEAFVPQKAQEPTWDLFKEWSDGDEGVGIERCEGARRTISLKIDDKTMSIMGVMPLPQGGGHVWLFFSEDVGMEELRISTACVKGFFVALKHYGYEWLQTPVRNDFRQGHKWATMLGFSKTEQEEDIMDNGIVYTYWTRVL